MMGKWERRALYLVIAVTWVMIITTLILVARGQ